MIRGDLFTGLPPEFSPPEKAAQHIAELATIAEREAYWLRIPEGWRPMVAHFAMLFIAVRIVAMEVKADRQNAIASVPDLWREDVKWHVVRLWRTREIRAEHQAELAAKRERQAA